MVLLLLNQQTLALEGIEELEWNNRIILIYSSHESSEIIDSLNNYDHDIKDRHIYWFVLSQNVLHSNYEGRLSEKLYSDILNIYFPDNEFNILLIGKDGEIKEKQNKLQLENMFSLIDTMPMRKREMLEKQ
jgi:hypothetical protein